MSETTSPYSEAVVQQDSLRSEKTNRNIELKFSLSRQQKKASHFQLQINTAIPGDGITAIVGPSGCGKTTFLRCIAGLEKSNGLISVGAEIWQNSNIFLAPQQRSVGYVFQEASLFPHLTGLKNIEFAMKRNGTNDPNYFEKICQILGIEALLTQYPDAMSGGEKQRVAIARALMSAPKILLMDEPLAALDHQRKQEILTFLEALKREISVPILYVSHSLTEVARLADHVAVMEPGKIMHQGSPREIFSRLDLAHGLTDETGTIIQCRVSSKDRNYKLMNVEFDRGQLWLGDDGTETGNLVRIRVLAKDISISLTEQQDTSILNKLPAQVAEILQEDESHIALVKLRTGNEYIIARITQKSLAQLKIKVGDSVWAQIKSVAVVR